MQKKGLRGRRRKMELEREKKGKTADCVLRRCLEQLRWEKEAGEQRESQYCVKWERLIC